MMFDHAKAGSLNETDREAATEQMASASFAYTEREFIASYRAVRMANHASYDSFIGRLGVILFGHLFVLGAVEIVILWLNGAEGKNGPIPGFAVCLVVAMGVVGSWMLYSRIYCYRRYLRRLYQVFPLRDEKIHYQFTPLRISFQHRLVFRSGPGGRRAASLSESLNPVCQAILDRLFLPFVHRRLSRQRSDELRRSTPRGFDRFRCRRAGINGSRRSRRNKPSTQTRSPRPRLRRSTGASPNS